MTGGQGVAGEGTQIGPGHPGILEDGDRCLLSDHFYDGARDGRPRLGIRPLTWGDDGWPEVAGPPISPPAE